MCQRHLWGGSCPGGGVRPAAAAGVRTTRAEDDGHRASGRGGGLRLRPGDRRGCPAGGVRAGPVRADGQGRGRLRPRGAVPAVCPGRSAALRPGRGGRVHRVRARGVRRGCRKVGAVVDRLRQLLHAQPVLHADQTPARVAGALRYVHVACTEQYTLFHVGGRCAADVDAGGVLPDFTGTIVRDGYAPPTST
ncbi:IS66 family transposase [Phytohabitans kaempferiae]|uniref:Transposase n=1 Tax=Phytohabitans kaempferiae TaxID=1620943 RepID=A0ABV6M8G2_9ACTN